MANILTSNTMMSDASPSPRPSPTDNKIATRIYSNFNSNTSETHNKYSRSSSPNNVSSAKTRMCNSILRCVKCPYGEKCRYAHSRSEIVTLPCNYNDNCIFVCCRGRGDVTNDISKGKICRFVHPSETIEQYHTRVGTPEDPPPSDMATWPSPDSSKDRSLDKHNFYGPPRLIRTTTHQHKKPPLDGSYVETSARRVSNKPAWMEDDFNSFSKSGIDAMKVIEAVEAALDKGCTTIVIKGIDYSSIDKNDDLSMTEDLSEQIDKMVVE